MKTWDKNQLKMIHKETEEILEKERPQLIKRVKIIDNNLNSFYNLICSYAKSGEFMKYFRFRLPKNIDEIVIKIADKVFEEHYLSFWKQLNEEWQGRRAVSRYESKYSEDFFENTAVVKPYFDEEDKLQYKTEIFDYACSENVKLEEKSSLNIYTLAKDWDIPYRKLLYILKKIGIPLKPKKGKGKRRQLLVAKLLLTEKSLIYIKMYLDFTKNYKEWLKILKDRHTKSRATHYIKRIIEKRLVPPVFFELYSPFEPAISYVIEKKQFPVDFAKKEWDAKFPARKVVLDRLKDMYSKDKMAKYKSEILAVFRKHAYKDKHTRIIEKIEKYLDEYLAL